MSLEADIDVLRRMPFFEGLADEHLQLVASSAEARSLPEKLLVFDEGQLLHSAYVIVSGTLVGQRRAKGGTAAQSRPIDPGVILGAQALILEIRATESVRVVSRARVLQIRKATFRRLLGEHPQIAVALRARLMRNFVQTTAELGEVVRRLAAIDRGA